MDNGKKREEKIKKECIKIIYMVKKKHSWALTARNKAELLMLEGGCVECSRWKKQEEMWKITYYARFRKWLDSCTVLSLSVSLHLSKKCHSNKILFSPHEFTHFGNQQITLLLHIFHSHAAQPVCSLFTLFVPSFAFTPVKTLTSFCTDGLMGAYQLSEGTSVSAGLYTCTSSGCVW